MMCNPRCQWVPLLLFLMSFPLSASAVLRGRTGGFSQVEIDAIQPLLKQHDVIGLSQFDRRGDPVSMTMATRIRASRGTVFEMFTNPDNYYYISTLFKENTVLAQHRNATLWSWASRHKFFSIIGKNSIALYPPHRAEVAIEESTLGTGRFSLRFYEDGDKHTILVISGFLEIESSEWLIRFLVRGNPAMIQAMNIAIGFVVLKGSRALAEQLEQGKPLKPHVTRGRAGGQPESLPSTDIEKLTPLLDRGQVFLCSSHPGGRLKQATLMDRVNASAKRFLEAAAIPENYGKHISAISDIRIHDRSPVESTFSWSLGLGIFSITSRNHLAPIEQGILLRGVDGDLKDAHWRWQVVPESSRSSVVAYHAYADPGAATSILRSTVRREPYLEHGLVMGSNIVMLRAMRRIVEPRKK